MGAYKVDNLAAFRLCEELTKAVEAATAIGKVAADRRFCNQINDAALDATSDVAEGFARYYPREFARFLDFAIGSLEEVHRRTEAGYRRGYFIAATTSSLLQLQARADKACRNLRMYLWSVKKADLPPPQHAADISEVPH